MPGQDGRGPMWGGGPGAGWGMGPCGAGYGGRRGFGRGRLGRGRGQGMGWGFMPGRVYDDYNYGYQVSKDEEMKMMEDEEAALKEELEAIQRAKQQLKSTKNPPKAGK